jgi:hypothetical protein
LKNKRRKEDQHLKKIKRRKKNSPRSDEIIAADCYDYDYYYVTCRSSSYVAG